MFGVLATLILDLTLNINLSIGLLNVFSWVILLFLRRICVLMSNLTTYTLTGMYCLMSPSFLPLILILHLFHILSNLHLTFGYLTFYIYIHLINHQFLVPMVLPPPLVLFLSVLPLILLILFLFCTLQPCLFQSYT